MLGKWAAFGSSCQSSPCTRDDLFCTDRCCKLASSSTPGTGMLSPSLYFSTIRTISHSWDRWIRPVQLFEGEREKEMETCKQAQFIQGSRTLLTKKGNKNQGSNLKMQNIWLYDKCTFLALFIHDLIIWKYIEVGPYLLLTCWKYAFKIMLTPITSP